MQRCCQPWGSNLGYSGFCRPHMWKQTKCIQDPRAPCGVSRMFIFTLRPQCIRTWQITVILNAGKPRAPFRDKNGRFKDLLRISVMPACVVTVRSQISSVVSIISRSYLHADKSLERSVHTSLSWDLRTLFLPIKPKYGTKNVLIALQQILIQSHINSEITNKFPHHKQTLW